MDNKFKHHLFSKYLFLVIFFNFLLSNPLIAFIDTSFTNPKTNMPSNKRSFNPSTHCGIDWASGFHTPIMSTNYGKKIVSDHSLLDPATSSCDSSATNRVIIRHLLTNGTYKYSRYIHLANEEEILYNMTYIGRGQNIGKEGRTGCTGTINPNPSATNAGVHLHYEINDRTGITYGATTKNMCEGAINPNGYYIPSSYDVLIPFLSLFDTPSNSSYSVFGIAGENLYGFLDIEGSYKEAGIIARKSFNRLDSEQGSKSASPKYVLQMKSTTQVAMNGLSGSTDEYKYGDYLFVGYLKDGNEYRYSYPVKLTILPNDKCIIVDNDQVNTDGYEYSQNLKSSDTNKVPGYFLSAQLIKGKSEATAHWKPNIEGKYSIYVHVPKGATASSVVYKIKPKGLDSVKSKPVNQMVNQDSWQQIIGENGETEFSFTNNGYISLYAGNDSSTGWIALDAFKFVNVKTWHGNASIISYHAKDIENVDNDDELMGLKYDKTKVHISSQNDDIPVVFFQWQMDLSGCNQLLIDAPELPYNEKEVDITVGYWSSRSEDRTFTNVRLPFIIGYQNLDLLFSDDSENWYVIKVAFHHKLTNNSIVEASCTSKEPQMLIKPKKNIDTCLLKGGYKWNGNGSIVSKNFQELKAFNCYGCFYDKTNIYPSSEKPAVFFQWQVGQECDSLNIYSSKIPDNENNVNITIGHWNTRDYDYTYKNTQLPFTISKDNSEFTFEDSDWYVIKMEYQNPVSIPATILLECGNKKKRSSNTFLSPPKVESKSRSSKSSGNAVLVISNIVLSPKKIYQNNIVEIIFNIKNVTPPRNDITLDIEYVYNNKSYLIVNDLEYTTGKYEWRPSIKGENIYLRVKATDSNGNVSDYFQSNKFNIEEYVQNKSENPSKVYLYGLGEKTNKNEVEISWRKIVDSNNEHNADKYEIEYSNDQNFEKNLKSFTVNKEPTTTNSYELFRHLIRDLNDDTKYYFRVRGVNNIGFGSWSNLESISIDIQNMPTFTSFHEPGNNATNVSKTPILKWRASDPDYDPLDYYVTISTSKDDLEKRSIRGFGHSKYYGIDQCNIAEEYKPLKPNTKYYWQIWVKEKGRYKDYYDGSYIKSDICEFTTVAEGSDLRIVDATLASELLPDSDVFFKVTVKNSGNEIAKERIIKADYFNGNKYTPFWFCSGYMNKDLNPSETEVVEIKLTFLDYVFKLSEDLIYDNVLIAGDSKIKFYFKNEDEQDVDSSNNSFEIPVNYKDKGKPIIEYFNLSEYGSMYYSSDDYFWARMGHKLHITVKAYDDILITSATLEYDLEGKNEWQILFQVKNNNDEMLNFNCSTDPNITCTSDHYDWPIPTDIKPTDNARIRVIINDSSGLNTQFTSNPFSIVSSNIDISIETENSPFKVGQDLQYRINNNSINKVKYFDVFLQPIGRLLLQNYNEEGLSFESIYKWPIPVLNNYASNVCYLEMQVKDIYGNEKRIYSERFSINPDTELPLPFKESKTIYDNAYQIPANSYSSGQNQNVKFIKIDNSNLVHCVIQHLYGFIENTNSGLMNDKITYSNKWLYIIYDPSTGDISSPINICSKDFDVVDFELYKNVAYVVLQNNNYKTQYYYSYSSGSSFVQPISLINVNVPKITQVIKNSEYNDDQDYLSNPNINIFLNKYIWVLDFFTNKIKRYSFSNGQIGDIDEFVIQNNAGSVSSYHVKPVTDGNNIYFLDMNHSKLVKLDTINKVADAYSLPDFNVSNDDEYNKISMVAKNQRVFIFADGRVFTLESGSIVEKGKISYTFNNKIIDYRDHWEDVFFTKTVINNNEISLIINLTSTAFYLEPVGTMVEILIFNPNNYNFSKKIVSVQKSLLNSSIQELKGSGLRSKNCDLINIGNNKVLAAFASDMSTSHELHLYFCYLNMLDLETGEVNYIGRLPILTDKEVSLYNDQGKIYAIGENCVNDTSECYQINIENINSRAEEVSYLNLVEYANKFYVTWRGNLFDGTWDNGNNKINSYNFRKNKFIQFGTSIENVNVFWDNYINSRAIVVSNDYIVFPQKASIYSLHPDFTINNIFYDENNNTSQDCNILMYGKKFAGIFSFFKGSDSSEIKLIETDLNSIAFDCDSSNNTIAEYDDSILVVGYNSKYHAVTKYDLATGELSTINQIARTESSQLINKVDINSNKYVAIGWANYVAVGDMSGDFIAPNISILNEGSDIISNSSIDLLWEADDNNDELIKYEVYKTVNNETEVLLTTITDISIKNYKYTFEEKNGDKVSFKIVAYDLSNNKANSTVTYNIEDPVIFTNFYSNKKEINVGEKIIFSWEATGVQQNTVYTLLYQTNGESSWIEHCKIVNFMQKAFSFEKLFGEYLFKIVSGDAEIVLSHTIKIHTDQPEFNHSSFEPKSAVYDVINKIVNFSWGIVGEYDDIEFNLFIKTNEDQQYQLIHSTPNMEFKYTFPPQSSFFDWKIETSYNGKRYISQSYHVSFMSIDSTEINLNQSYNGENKPLIEISFSNVENFRNYAIFRRDSIGKTENIAVLEENTNSFLDTEIVYGESYDYAVVPIINENIGQIQDFKSIEVNIKPVKKIDIENQNPVNIITNQITVYYKPDPDDCYDNYEILIGKSIDALQQYEITTKRSILIENLEYDSIYFVQIYPLDNQNERLLQTPAQLIVTTGPEVYTLVPSFSENGKIIPSNPIDVEFGENVTFVIIPEVDYAIEDVKVNNESVGKIESYTFKYISSNQSISALFNRNIVKQSIPLHKGWNLISFNVNKCFYIGEQPVVPMIAGIEYQQVESINYILSSLNNQYSYVEGFDVTGAKSYNKTIFSDMKYMAAGYGYWIKLDVEGPLYLEIEGPPISEIASIELHPGWNLVGYLGNTAKYVTRKPTVLFPESTEFQLVNHINDIFNSITGKYSYIESFDSTGGKSYNLTPFSDLYYVGPGYGFWIKIDSQENVQLIWE